MDLVVGSNLGDFIFMTLKASENRNVNKRRKSRMYYINR